MNEKHAGSSLVIRKLMFSISTLEDLGRVLSSSEDFRARLKTGLCSIMGTLPVARGGVLLHRTNGGGEASVELLATRGVELGPGILLPLPDGVREGLVSHQQAILRSSPPHFLKRYLDDYQLIFQGLQTEIIQPLVFKREFLGVICLGGKYNGEPFTAGDMELLKIMADYVSIGLHNQNLLVSLEKTNVVLRRKVVENSRLYSDLQDMYKDTVRALGATIDAKDPYTAGHSERVARYSVSIAQHMGLNSEEINAIDLASHLHDIGKIAIDNSILCKPETLNPEEYEAIHRHPLISFDILSNIRFPCRDVALIAKHHHERLNGQGYPDGIRGVDMTVGMKVLALADAFDAMTSDRPYRPALSVEDALEEIGRWISVQFDSEVTRAFLRALREELDDEPPAHGIICNMGKRCDPRKVETVVDRMLVGLASSRTH